MSIKCDASGCSKFSTVYCDCTAQRAYFCQNHLSHHMKSGVHHIKSLYKQVNPLHKLPIYNKILSNIAELRKVRETYKQSIAHSINVIGKLSRGVDACFSKLMRIMNGMLKEIVENDRVMVLGRGRHDLKDEVEINDIFCELKLRFQQIHNTKIEIEYNDIYSMISESNKYLEQGFKALNDTLKWELTLPQQPIDRTELVNSDQNLYFFKRNTKNLIEFSTLSLEFRTLHILTLENQGWLSALCWVPPSSLFLSGGYSTEFLASTYLINLSLRTCEILPNIRERDSSSAIFHNEKIFIFGGFDNSGAMCHSDMFDLKEKKWKKLSDLPVNVFDTSSAIYRNEGIVVSGYENFLMRYDLRRDLYEMLGEVQVPYYNLLINDGQRMVLLTSVNVYVSEGDLKEWKAGDREYNFGASTCKPVIRDKFAYFYDWDSKVYSFSLDTFELKHIGTFSHASLNN